MTAQQQFVPVADRKGHTWDFNAKARTYTRGAGHRELTVTWLTGSSYPYVLEVRFADGSLIDQADFETFDAAATYAHYVHGH